jgi:hypothetical protein
MADRAAQQRFLVPFFRERGSRVELQEVEPGRLQAIATRSGTGGANQEGLRTRIAKSLP